tara:strand:+ start:289 stop:633 length:345 start_codon:yes stop_codon:yes gene_type:complete
MFFICKLRGKIKQINKQKEIIMSKRKKRTKSAEVRSLMLMALRALGGSAHQEEVFIWLADNIGEKELRRRIGKFDWMYPFRWKQSNLRHVENIMVPWEESGKGIWKLEWTHMGR